MDDFWIQMLAPRGWNSWHMAQPSFMCLIVLIAGLRSGYSDVLHKHEGSVVQMRIMPLSAVSCWLTCSRLQLFMFSHVLLWPEEKAITRQARWITIDALHHCLQLLLGYNSILCYCRCCSTSEIQQWFVFFGNEC